MKNYAIQCHFSTPYLAGERPTYLDGILADISFQQHLNALDEQAVHKGQNELPLAKTMNPDGDFVYHASTMLMCGDDITVDHEPIITSFTYQYDRLNRLLEFQDKIHFPTPAKTIHIARQFKNRLNAYQKINIQTGWFAFRGELDPVMSLLSQARNLGVKRNYNYGKVSKYSFYEIEEDCSFMTRHGWLVSRIPLHFTDVNTLLNGNPSTLFTRQYSPYRSPYCPQYGGKRTECLVPDRTFYRDDEVKRQFRASDENLVDELVME